MASDNENKKYIDQELTEKIIGCAFTVHRELGEGFLEKVYHSALLIALREEGIVCQSEVPLTVYFRGQEVGQYTADIIVEKRVVLELKALETVHAAHEVQLKNYLRATGIEVGLLINFGKKVEIRRKYVPPMNPPSASS